MSIRYYGHPVVRAGAIAAYTAKIHDGDNITSLPPRFDISRHADGFAWGPIMVGTRPSKATVPGAAQLALALLCHALNNDGRALALHQRFKMRVMEKWPADHAWSMTPEEIAVVCDKIEENDSLTVAARVEVSREPVIGDREPAVGLASETTSAGHRNDIPGEKVRDDG